MAVYTDVTDEDLASFLAEYDVGDLRSYKGIAEGVENTNYIVHTTTGPFILTLYEKRVNPAELPYFLGLMEHLAKAGVSCATPVRDRQGNNLKELSNRKAALVTFLEGFCPKKPTAHHCAELGKALAKFHLAGQNFNLNRANALSVQDWRPLFEEFSAQADSIAPGLTEIIESELATYENAWPQGLPSGVIHADLFPDNVFFIGNKLSGLIDFYFACNDALAYDIAICLNAWCFEPDFSYNYTKGQALLRAYEGVRPLTRKEVDALPILARGAAMRFLLTRCYDWLNTPKSAVVKPHNPVDYLRRLRFHQTTTSLADYGYEVQS